MYCLISDRLWYVVTTTHSQSDVAGFILVKNAIQLEILWVSWFYFYTLVSIYHSQFRMIDIPNFQFLFQKFLYQWNKIICNLPLFLQRSANEFIQIQCIYFILILLKKCPIITNEWLFHSQLRLLYLASYHRNKPWLILTLYLTIQISSHCLGHVT